MVCSRWSRIFVKNSTIFEDTETLAADAKLLCTQYLAAFGSDRTDLLYHHRLDGPLGIGALSSPAEIAVGTVDGKPMPYGYGSGIQDVPLENGQFLFALCDVFDSTGDPEIGQLAQRIFRGIRLVATVSPEPGFAPRGPHPDGKSYRGENYNRSVVLALLLWAAEARRSATPATQFNSSTLGRLDLGPSMDVEFQNGLLYAIGKGKLHAVDVSDPNSPVVKGAIDGLGRVRQLCVHDGIAYVTSREDGLYLVDVSSPDKMRILAHYDTIELATGIAGLHAIEIAPEIRPLATHPTNGFSLGVAAWEGRVYVAEGEGGLSIWKHAGAGQLELLGRYRAPNDSVRQVVVAGKYTLLHVGPSTLHIVDVSNPREPSRVLEDSRLGLFYYNPISPGLLADQYACCHWHVTGLHWYDLLGDTPRWTGQNYPFRIDSRNGAAFVGEQALVTCRGGYALISIEEQRPLDELVIHRIPSQIFHGKPIVAGDRLYVSDRYTGIVTAIDISDLEKPQLVDRLELQEHPGLVVVHNGTPIIPAGYQGLLIWDKCGTD
jgi:hypothetical protein